MPAKDVPPSLSHGFVQVYTGDGKGKTTAALGLAVRAAGAGLRVYLAQFMKGRDSGEVAGLKRFADRITLRRHGGKCFVEEPPDEADIAAARDGLREAALAMRSGDYQMVILDEANVAAHVGLFTVDDLMELIRARPADVELVITGRSADRRVVEAADLVTDMVAVKHYFDRGVPAREGIEK